MISRQELARVALRTALDIRREAGTSADSPICIYDFAESLGTEVWFVGGSTFSGMYPKGYGRLFVPAERPPGRRAFTCAHELAHWHFDHGSRVEEIDFDRSDHEVPEEILANTFASYLLMPRPAVRDAFHRRQLEPDAADPTDIYSVACQLGVGYETLIKHLRWSLNLLPHARMEDLLAISPKEIRRAILGTTATGHLVLASEAWRAVAIDLEVGDLAVVPHGVQLCGDSVRTYGQSIYGIVVEAIQPGLSQAIKSTTNDWAAMIRVCRRHFVGRGAYRHLEDPDEIE